MENVTTLTINLDASEAVKGLKQLQREARKTVQALREVEQAYTPNRDFESTYKTYLSHVMDLCGKDAQPRYINRQLYDAIMNDEFRYITIHYRRCDGATISALAALKTFDDVVYITRYKSWISPYIMVDRAYGLDEPLRGHDELRKARVILLDHLSVPEFGHLFPLKQGQRIISLYGHDYDPA